MKKTILSLAVTAILFACGSNQTAFGSSTEKTFDEVKHVVTQFVDKCFADDVKEVSVEKPVSFLLTSAIKAELELRVDLMIPLNDKPFKVQTSDTLPEYHDDFDHDGMTCRDLDGWLSDKVYTNTTDFQEKYGVVSVEALTQDDTSAIISYVSYKHDGEDKLLKIKFYSAN